MSALTSVRANRLLPGMEPVQVDVHYHTRSALTTRSWRKYVRQSMAASAAHSSRCARIQNGPARSAAWVLPPVNGSN